MNVDDVKLEDGQSKTPVEFLAKMFAAQTKLMEKYHPIEARNGCIVVELPAHIDDAHTQMRLKDMFWRTTEEICEALENVGDLNFAGWVARWTDDAGIRHFFEELADALHFLTEATIIAGYSAEEIAAEEVFGLASKVYEASMAPTPIEMRIRCMDFITNLGLAANTLKNKPWKVTQMATDQRKFYRYLIQSWISFLAIFYRTGAKMNVIETMYFKKNKVNIFRQESAY